MGEIVAIRELITLLGQPLQLVMIRAVVVVAVDVEVTVFLIELDLVQVLDAGQQIVGVVDELAALRGAAPSAARSGQKVTILLAPHLRFVGWLLRSPRLHALICSFFSFLFEHRKKA